MGGVLLVGCSPSESVDTPASRAEWDDQTVARVDGNPVSLDAFQEAWQRQGDAKSKEQVLEQLVDFQAVLVRAQQAGLENDPVIRTAYQQMLVSKFQEQELERRLAALGPIREESIEASYRDQLETYTTPAMARGAVISFQVSGKAGPDQRAEVAGRAQAVWAQAQEATDVEFRLLVQRNSEDQSTRYQGGETGWLTREQVGFGWDRPVVDALFALTAAGDLAPLVETDRGFYVVKLLQRKEEQVRPLADVRSGILYQLEIVRREAVRKQFMHAMRSDLAVEINHTALDSATRETRRVAAPSTPPSLP